MAPHNDANTDTDTEPPVNMSNPISEVDLQNNRDLFNRDTDSDCTEPADSDWDTEEEDELDPHEPAYYSRHYRNCLLDLEASEANSEADQDLTSEEGDPRKSFPSFMKLPVELREMVWAAFCHDLLGTPRVFEIVVVDVGGFIPGACLHDQTAPLRALLAIHHETRALALKSSPREFPMFEGCLRYHEQDVILLAFEFRNFSVTMNNWRFYMASPPPNIALEFSCYEMHGLPEFCLTEPQIKRIFIIDDDESYHTKDITWCASEKVHNYYIETYEDEPGVGEDTQTMLCWPDLDENREYAEQEVDKDENDGVIGAVHDARFLLAESVDDFGPFLQPVQPEKHNEEALHRHPRVEVWPMIRFTWPAGMERFNNMKAWKKPWDEWETDSDRSSYPDDLENAYESDGIDDFGPISEHSWNSWGGPGHWGLVETNVYPAEFSSDSEATDEGSEGDTSHSEDSLDSRRVDESDDEDESVTESEEPRRVSGRRARVLLADSEDESDEEGAGPESVRGMHSRGRATLPTDSEDDDDQDEDDALRPPCKVKRSRRATVPADSDDEDDRDSNDPQPSRTADRRARAADLPADSADEDGHDSESDSQGGDAEARKGGSTNDGESDSEEDYDEPPAPKLMSLAKRLRMESKQAAVRTAASVNDDSGADDVSNHDCDDDEEDEDDGGEMVMGMAEEYDGEERESEERESEEREGDSEEGW